MSEWNDGRTEALRARLAVATQWSRTEGWAIVCDVPDLLAAYEAQKARVAALETEIAALRGCAITDRNVILRSGDYGYCRACKTDWPSRSFEAHTPGHWEHIKGARDG